MEVVLGIDIGTSSTKGLPYVGMNRTSGAARGWYGCHSFVVAKLTGECVLDHHTASQCDPPYRVPEFEWHQDWAMEI